MRVDAFARGARADRRLRADPRDLGLLSFNLGVPKQPPAVSGVDVALVRDGRIAVLYTLLTAQS